MAWQRILGIDPGSRISGYAVLESEKQSYRYVASGVIKLNNLELPQKLGKIATELKAIIEDYQPEQASVENVFLATNPRSALLLGQARGAAIACLATCGLEVHEYSAKAIKKAITGYGNADKDQVAFMTCRLLQIAEREHRDETDAMAIALCHAFHQPVVRARTAQQTSSSRAHKTTP